MAYAFKRMKIPDVILVIPDIFKHERGYLMESYKKSEFKKNGINLDFVQDNHIKSKKGAIHGLHYQLNPYAQGKLVRVIKGSIFDVAVDIRKGSPTYGLYVAVKLTATNKKMLYIPPGFAHGVCSLEDKTEFVYKNTAEYSPKHRREIFWKDPEINIKWPKIKNIVSEKDKNAPFLRDADNNFVCR